MKTGLLELPGPGSSSQLLQPVHPADSKGPRLEKDIQRHLQEFSVVKSLLLDRPSAWRFGSAPDKFQMSNSSSDAATVVISTREDREVDEEGAGGRALPCCQQRQCTCITACTQTSPATPTRFASPARLSSRLPSPEGWDMCAVQQGAGKPLSSHTAIVDHTLAYTGGALGLTDGVVPRHRSAERRLFQSTFASVILPGCQDQTSDKEGGEERSAGASSLLAKSGALPVAVQESALAFPWFRLPVPSVVSRTVTSGKIGVDNVASAPEAEDAETIVPEDGDECSPRAGSSLLGDSAAVASDVAPTSPCSLQSPWAGLGVQGSLKDSSNSSNEGEDESSLATTPGTARLASLTPKFPSPLPTLPARGFTCSPVCPDFNLSPLERVTDLCPCTPTTRKLLPQSPTSSQSNTTESAGSAHTTTPTLVAQDERADSMSKNVLDWVAHGTDAVVGEFGAASEDVEHMRNGGQQKSPLACTFKQDGPVSESALPSPKCIPNSRESPGHLYTCFAQLRERYAEDAKERAWESVAFDAPLHAELDWQESAATITTKVADNNLQPQQSEETAYHSSVESLNQLTMADMEPDCRSHQRQKFEGEPRSTVSVVAEATSIATGSGIEEQMPAPTPLPVPKLVPRDLLATSLPAFSRRPSSLIRNHDFMRLENREIGCPRNVAASDGLSTWFSHSCLLGAARWLHNPKVLDDSQTGSLEGSLALEGECPDIDAAHRSSRSSTQTQRATVGGAAEVSAWPECGGRSAAMLSGSPVEIDIDTGITLRAVDEALLQDTETLPAGSESIRSESTLLSAIQRSDGQLMRKQREVTIQVPEGVGTDLKVRVNLQNMPEELLVPEGAEAGEVVTCDLPTVAPLASSQQRHILHEDILMTKLRWVQTENGTWVTDEARKQKKHEAYRMLRGRRMGTVLISIPEGEVSGEHAENSVFTCVPEVALFNGKE